LFLVAKLVDQYRSRAARLRSSRLNTTISQAELGYRGESVGGVSSDLYFTAILEIHWRIKHHLVAIADLNCRSQVANLSDLAAFGDAILDHQRVEAVAVENDRPCRHDQ
jgi:hypothetical protein